MHPSVATRNRIAPRIVSLVTAVVKAGWQGVQQSIIAIKHRRDALRLANYDDHMLADVGLTRDNVSAALGEPFWHDPTVSLANCVAEPRRGKSFVKSVAIGASAALLMAAYGSEPANADEIRLLSAAAMQSVFKEIAGDFERGSGHKLIIRYATIGAIRQRVQGGELADLVIGPSLSMPGLVEAGKIDSESRATVCTTGIGINAEQAPCAPPSPRLPSPSRASTDMPALVVTSPLAAASVSAGSARSEYRPGLFAPRRRAHFAPLTAQGLPAS